MGEDGYCREGGLEFMYMVSPLLYLSHIESNNINNLRGQNKLVRAAILPLSDNIRNPGNVIYWSTGNSKRTPLLPPAK